MSFVMHFRSTMPKHKKYHVSIMFSDSESSVFMSESPLPHSVAPTFSLHVDAMRNLRKLTRNCIFGVDDRQCLKSVENSYDFKLATRNGKPECRRDTYSQLPQQHLDHLARPLLGNSAQGNA